MKSLILLNQTASARQRMIVAGLLLVIAIIICSLIIQVDMSLFSNHFDSFDVVVEPIGGGRSRGGSGPWPGCAVGCGI